jgi:hypothetical protein
MLNYGNGRAAMKTAAAGSIRKDGRGKMVGATHLLTGDQQHIGPLFGQQIAGVLILPPAKQGVMFDVGCHFSEC